MTDKNQLNIDEKEKQASLKQKKAELRKKKSEVPGEIKPFMRAVPVVLAAIAVFITLCFITGETGAFGSFVSRTSKGLFSYMAYTIPAFIAWHAIFYFDDVKKHKVIKRLIFSVVFLVTLSEIAYIIPNIRSELVYNAKELFALGAQCKGGGVVGGSFAFLITNVLGLGKVGLFVVIALVIALYSIFFFYGEKSDLYIFFLQKLRKLVNIGAELEKSSQIKKTRSAEEKLEKKRADDDRKNAAFYQDDYFNTDSGMSSLEIPELGIAKTIHNNAPSHRLMETVIHTEEEPREKPRETQTAASETRDEKERRMFDLSTDAFAEKKTKFVRAEVSTNEFNENDIVYEAVSETEDEITVSVQSTSEDEITEDISAEKIEEPISAQPFTAEKVADVNNEFTGYRMESPMRYGLDDSADAVFTSEFDPLDIALNEKRAAKVSTCTENAITEPKGFTESIPSITAEQSANIERLRIEEEQRAEAERLRKEADAAMREAIARENAKVAEERMANEARKRAEEAMRVSDPKTAEISSAIHPSHEYRGAYDRVPNIADINSDYEQQYGASISRASSGDKYRFVKETVQEPRRQYSSSIPPQATVATPVYEAPVAKAPVYEAPVTQTPVYEAPVAKAPAYEAPVAKAPVYEAPVAKAPVYEAPEVKAPTYNAVLEDEKHESDEIKVSAPVFTMDDRSAVRAPENTSVASAAQTVYEEKITEKVDTEPKAFSSATVLTFEPVSAEENKTDSDAQTVERVIFSSDIRDSDDSLHTETRINSESSKQTLEISREMISSTLGVATVTNSEAVYESTDEIYSEDEDTIEKSTTVSEEDAEEIVPRTEIPKEKQNPAISGYREMFDMFRGEENNGGGESLTDTSFTDSEEEENDIREISETSDTIEKQITLISENESTEEADIDTEVSDEPPFDIDEEDLDTEFEDMKQINEMKEEAPKRPDYSKYKFPSCDLLKPGTTEDIELINEEIQLGAEKLISTLEAFNIRATMRGIERGPRVTRYSIVPAKGIRVGQIEKLSDDIVMGLAAETIRIEAPIPGKSAVGIEIPNKISSIVSLRDLIESDQFTSKTSKTTVCIGKSVEGLLVYGDLSAMPHLLIAGATGMGKSVCMNSLILSILYKARPDEVKFIMIDPKKVEFAPYKEIPHLLVPVVTEPKQAAGALYWAVEEMNKRYDVLEKFGSKNIDSYNERVKANPDLGEPMHKIVIFIDELNDLMMQMRDPVENLITMIAQKARAAGIHLVIGTQRPSVNVITGVIKSNIPTRIACKVTSGIDSRTIIDVNGAEKLIGKGDMLFSMPDFPTPKRVQGAYVSESETVAVVDFIKSQCNGVAYDEEAFEDMKRAAVKCDKSKKNDDMADDGDGESNDNIYNDKRFVAAVELAIRSGTIATSYLQRKLTMGYGKAAKYIDIMQDLGIVAPKSGAKPREILITMDEWKERLARYT
ncbi:MAG: hypothetical protein E7617_01280 [Ruminococcaceae bacterium]|nr:hypothetical protein [Oscillospiraceae bacterium]